MGRIGMAELIIVLMIAVVYIIPIAAAVWALVMLKQLRDGQRAVEGKLDTIAHILQR